MDDEPMWAADHVVALTPSSAITIPKIANQFSIKDAHDEALVPITDRVNISSTNLSMDPPLTQKEETFQVILDIIKASLCYNAFLITANVPGIYMKILDICPRVPNEYFIVPPSEESLINFLYELGYKDQINKLASVFIDYMHQPWRTLASIINKCLYKGSQGKKQTITPKKKSSISADDNIILKPDVAFELGKSISKIEAEISEEERRLHETHERLVTVKPTRDEESDESDGEPAYMPTGRRRPFERLAADTKKAIKASKEAHILQQQTEDLSKGACITPEVLDELTGKFTTLSEGSGIVPKVPDEENPFEQRDECPAQPRVVYLPILNFNYYHHLLNILENYNPMDDEPMWAADRVVAPTPSSAITILETVNKFAIKGYHLTLVKGNQFDVLLKLDWAKNQKTKSSLKKIVAFADDGSSNSDTDKIMVRMVSMTMKMDARYKELKSRSNNTNPDCNDDDIPMSRKEEAKFMQTF
ncbi:hypothetical protein Tco_0484558 [Tanacetum coccineum]